MDKRTDLITVNSSALTYCILSENVDLNRVKAELDSNTGNIVFVLPKYSRSEIEAYKSYIKAVKNGTAIQVDIIEFNHIYSCLKQMIKDYKCK